MNWKLIFKKIIRVPVPFGANVAQLDANFDIPEVHWMQNKPPASIVLWLIVKYVQFCDRALTTWREWYWQVVRVGKAC